MSFAWEPIPWRLGYFAARKAKKGFVERASIPLSWSRASADWPPADAPDIDLDFARQNGDGFIAETDDEVLFLLNRSWSGWPDPPQWGLVSQSKTDGKWQRWGSFEPLPQNWKLEGSVG